MAWPGVWRRQSAALLGKAADWCQALRIPIVKLGRLLVVEDALTAAFEEGRRRQYDDG